MKKKYYKFTKINHSTLIVGIDIGKNTHYGYLRTLLYDGSKSFPFSNTKEGFEQLIKRIKQFEAKHKTTNVIIGLESTGSYWLPLAYYLKQNTHYQLVQINGKHTKRFKDVTDNTSRKTDQKDPRVIAQIILIGSSLRVSLPEGDKAVIRELTRSRKAILEDKKRAQNRLLRYLSQYFPEFEKLFKDITCKTALYLLKEYPNPDDILKTNEGQLISELRKLSRGRFTAEKVKQLITYSKDSIGIKQGIEAYEMSLLIQIEQVEFALKKIQEIENRIKAKLVRISEYYILKSIKGLGDMTIATIISEVGDFARFRNTHELEKYSGLNLVENSSGRHYGQKRISKIGNEHLRCALYFGVLRMIKKGGVYYEVYQKHLEKGMKKKKAIIVISKKMLRTIHSLVKNEQMFELKYIDTTYHQAA
ncbi:MAG TPA: IS110 family transposase [Balneolales bacterium]|nr:IS110 family transposase [Balneolales bacterium]